MYLRNVILVAIVFAIASFAQPIQALGPAGGVFAGVATTPSTLDGPYLVRYAANLAAGESYINVTNTGANGASIFGPGYGPQTGNICVNVYAIDPNEELVSCCSCLLTPDQTVHLGVVANLINSTETGKTPTSVTVKLLASVGVNSTAAGAAVTSPTTCALSAAQVGSNLGTGTIDLPIPGAGMLAWGTTLHLAAGSTVQYTTTESPFLPATLAVTEAESLSDRCAQIIGNASGSGQCPVGCTAGALGAQKM